MGRAEINRNRESHVQAHYGPMREWANAALGLGLWGRPMYLHPNDMLGDQAPIHVPAGTRAPGPGETWSTTREQRRHPLDPRWDNDGGWVEDDAHGPRWHINIHAWSESDEDTYDSGYESGEYAPANHNNSHENGQLNTISREPEPTIHPNFEDGDYIEDHILQEVDVTEILRVLEDVIYNEDTSAAESSTAAATADRVRHQQALFDALRELDPPAFDPSFPVPAIVIESETQARRGDNGQGPSQPRTEWPTSEDGSRIWESWEDNDAEIHITSQVANGNAARAARAARASESDEVRAAASALRRRRQMDEEGWAWGRGG